MISFQEVFERMGINYKQALALINPKYGELSERGFTERNLSVNFIEGYKVVSPKSIGWYEIPIEKSIKQNGHIDAIIVDAENNAIVYIESKRVYSSKKEKEAENDLRRLIEACNEGITRKICGEKSFEEYFVIVADIWEDEQQKRDRLERWRQSKVFNDFEGEYFVQDVVTHGVCKVKDYHLLGFVVKNNSNHEEKN